MSALDLSHSPSIEAVLIGLNNQSRFDLVESADLEKEDPAFGLPEIRGIEGGAMLRPISIRSNPKQSLKPIMII